MKKYFQRDWGFYAIAALLASNLEKSEIDDCIQKLKQDAFKKHRYIFQTNRLELTFSLMYR